MWAGSVLVGWLVCLPLLGPYGALAGVLPALLVFGPLPELLGYRVRHLKTPGLRMAWSPRHCLAPRGVAVVVAHGALGGLLLWGTWPLLSTVLASLAVILLIVCLGLMTTASGIQWRHTAPARPGDPPRVAPAPSVTRWALGSALLLGILAWALRRGVLPVAYGSQDLPTDHERFLRMLREADQQLQGTVFGPSVTQWYWPLLVAGAGLLAGGVAAALRGAPLDRTPITPVGTRPAARVFLSYARADGAIARPYVEALKGAGQDVWVDWEGIKPSREWREELAKAIRSSDALVVLISPASLSSPYCWDECRQALEQGKRVLPVVVDATIDAPAAMASADWRELTEFQLLSMRGPEEFETAVRETVAFVGDEYAWVAQHTRLGEQAHAWRQHQHAPGWLLRRHELISAEAWLAHRPTAADFHAEPNSDQVAYVKASRLALRRRRRGGVLAAVAAVCALTAVASLVAVTQEDRARQNREELSRMLAQAADSRPYPGMAAAARLAAAAYGEADTVEARAALQEQLQRFQHTGPRLSPESTSEQQGFSADSSVFAVTIEGRTRIWNVPRWTVRQTVNGVLPRDASRALSADGSRIVVFDDGGARVVDTRSGRILKVIEGSGGVPPSGALTPDGRRAIASTADGASTVVARVDGGDTPLRAPSCLSPSLSPRGRYVWCSGELSGTGVLMAVADGTQQPFPRRPLFEGWTYDDRPIVEHWPDQSLTDVQVLDASGPDASWTLPDLGDGSDTEVWGVNAVSPDGTRLMLFSVISTGTVYEVWDLRRHRRLGRVTDQEVEQRGLPTPIFGDDGEELLAGLVEADQVYGMSLSSFDTIHDPVRFSPDRHAAVTDTEEGLWAWRLDGWGRLVSQAGAPGVGTPTMYGSALSPDGRTLAVAYEDARLALYDVRTGRKRAEHRLRGVGVSVAYRGDGQSLAVGELFGDERDGYRVQVGLFTADATRRTGTLTSSSPPDLRAYVVGMAFSPNGQRLYLGESQLGVVREWDVAERRQVRTYGDERSANYLDAAVLSPDGQTIATADRQSIVSLWSARTGRLLYRIQEAGSRVAFSPDGHRIVMTGDATGASVTVWDVAAKRQVGGQLNVSAGDGEVVRDAVFTPDGRALMVVGETAESTVVVRRWELGRQAEPGPVLAEPAGAEGQLHMAVNSTDIVAPGHGTIIRILNDPDQWQSSLCDLADRWISPKEWQAVAPDQRYPTSCRPPGD
ncbi:toll/interleukin-1 receptor domain-containing protein [Streptomyces aquilus]|uniref:toll/interleukin-1 receptor domain-containing protein n=1 Tax=Streptomyces aquilus TaxID=2548456 RepID=UPI0036817836